jgi:hypothetical protein
VLFVGENGPNEVVVKPGEAYAAEGVMAALLHNEVRAMGGKGTPGGGGGSAPMTVAPGFRIATTVESQSIKTGLTPLVQNIQPVPLTPERLAFLTKKYANAKDPNVLKGQIKAAEEEKKTRAQELVGQLDQPGVTVQDVAAGRGLTEAVEELEQHIEKRWTKGTKLTKNSPLRLIKAKQTARALGMTTAVDLFTGNEDRLLKLNADNLMVRAYDIQGNLPLPGIAMIDNIYSTGLMSSFETRQVFNPRGKTTTQVSADTQLKAWMSDGDVMSFAKGDYAPIGQKVFDQLVTSLVPKATSKAGDPTKAAAELTTVLQSYKQRFIENFCDGLGQGKWTLVDSIKKMINNPKQLQDLAPGVDLTSLLSTMKKRREFLES